MGTYAVFEKTSSDLIARTLWAIRFSKNDISSEFVNMGRNFNSFYNEVLKIYKEERFENASTDGSCLVYYEKENLSDSLFRSIETILERIGF